MKPITIALCLACNKELRGRVDKKYCDDYCRNNFNNRIKSDTNNFSRNIINQLRKNKLILEEILGDSSLLKISRDRLLERGFHFKYHTHTYENKKGNLYIFCFEYGYLSLEKDWFLLVKREAEYGR
jgi:hypothetical protein